MLPKRWRNKLREFRDAECGSLEVSKITLTAFLDFWWLSGGNRLTVLLVLRKLLVVLTNNEGARIEHALGTSIQLVSGTTGFHVTSF